jgi:hypothetical protein
MLWRKLARIPADLFPKLFRDLAGLIASHLSQDNPVAVAMNEPHWNVEIEQAFQGLSWHRAREHIAADDDFVYVCAADIIENRLKRGKVSVNVVEGSDAHCPTL